jgi:hypothetical protein
MGLQTLTLPSLEKRLELELASKMRSPLDIFTPKSDINVNSEKNEGTDWFVIMVMGCGILMITCGMITILEWMRR